MKRTSLLAVSLAIGLAASACSSTKHTGATTTGGTTAASPGGSTPADPGAPKKAGGTITISNEQGQTWPCQFNPFNPSVYAESNGFVYEPLIYVDLLKDQAETPMLASKYQWNSDKTQVVFTIRDGVKWSDGKPMTADDVAFTFNLMKGNDALDLYALWKSAGLTEATAAGNQVTLKFKQNAQIYFYNFANQVVIVPKHIWSAGDAAAKPDQWADAQPIGTGPFVPKCDPNNIEYTANPTYWQPGKPYIQKIEYPAYLDNGPANQDLAIGKAQWGSQFIPSIKSFYLDKSPDNHTWSPPVLNVAIYPNNDPSHKATSQAGVRQAISLAIDRAKVSAIGEDGQEPPANQTGVVLPTFQKYYDAAAVAAAGFDKPDTAKASSLLAAAGYSPANPLKLEIITITGYTDWDASLAVIKDELKPVGVDLSIKDLDQQTFNTKLLNGDYDLAYYGQPSGGPTPYYELREILHSANTAPLGQAATGGNMERYHNPDVDKLFDKYATDDATAQVADLRAIGAAMLKDVPVIPVTESVDWFQYNTKDIQGWPTKDDPYAQPAAFNWPDVEQVLLHLYSKAAQ
jgi:peptide/nickel transport system substrate-binding protein